MVSCRCQFELAQQPWEPTRLTVHGKTTTIHSLLTYQDIAYLEQGYTGIKVLLPKSESFVYSLVDILHLSHDLQG